MSGQDPSEMGDRFQHSECALLLAGSPAVSTMVASRNDALCSASTVDAGSYCNAGVGASSRILGRRDA